MSIRLNLNQIEIIVSEILKENMSINFKGRNNRDLRTQLINKEQLLVHSGLNYFINKIPKERFLPVEYNGELDLTRLFYHFLINAGVFEGFLINLNIVHFILHPNIEIKNENSERDRLESAVTIKIVKDLLMNVGGGYIFGRESNSVRLANRKKHFISGFGYDYVYENAENKAFYEYIERYSATMKLKNTIVTSRKGNEERFINPKLLGLYETSVSIKNNLEIYSDDLTLEWVEGVSLFNKKEIYVPEQYVQYLNSKPLNRFIYDNSNGSAVGNSVNEAILHSLLESIERSVFIKSWFMNQEKHQVVFDINQTSNKARELYFAELGYSLEFYLLNNNEEIFVVWCVIRSVDCKNLLYSISGFNCGVDIKKVIDGAFFEALRSFLDLRSNKSNIENIRRVGNKKSLDGLEDHIFFFASNKNKKYLEGKLENKGLVSLSHLAKDSNENLTVNARLDKVINFLKNKYDEVIIVSQQNDLLDSLSLYCYKTILVGETPIDFGSTLVRVTGNEVSKVIKKEKNIHPIG